MQLAARKVEVAPFHAEVIGTPLSVVFAEGDAITAARDHHAERIALCPPFHVSDEDAYLVLPDDIGMEFIDILRDGDSDLLQEALRDGLLVAGWLEKRGRGQMDLLIEETASPLAVLNGTAATYAVTAPIAPGKDPVPHINGIAQLKCTVGSLFLDDQGLEAMVKQRDFIGTSWRVGKKAPPELQGDPTYIWSRHLGPGRIGVELAVFQEYEELVAMLRPLTLVAG